MAFEVRENSGSMFVNQRKQKDTHPDFQGTVNVDGTLKQISAWKKEDKNGNDWYSFSFSEPYQKDGSGGGKSSKSDDLDGVPF